MWKIIFLACFVMTIRSTSSRLYRIFIFPVENETGELKNQGSEGAAFYELRLGPNLEATTVGPAVTSTSQEPTSKAPDREETLSPVGGTSKPSEERSQAQDDQSAPALASPTTPCSPNEPNPGCVTSTSDSSLSPQVDDAQQLSDRDLPYYHPILRPQAVAPDIRYLPRGPAQDYIYPPSGVAGPQLLPQFHYSPRLEVLTGGYHSHMNGFPSTMLVPKDSFKFMFPMPNVIGHSLYETGRVS